MAVRLPCPVSAADLAARCGGVLHGGDRAVYAVAPADEADADALAFLDKTRACAAGVVLARTPRPAAPGHRGIGGPEGATIVVDDPLGALCSLLDALLPEPGWAPVDIDPSARVGAGVHLSPGVRIGADCVVEDGCVLFPNVVLYPRTHLRRDVRVHAGSVLGADGFRVHAGAAGARKVPHVAGVQVGEYTEIGANCTIDRGFLTDTRIGPQCRLDAQVHIGHNTVLGRGVLIAAQTGISGSVRIEDHAVLGGQVGIADHITVGRGARIGAQSGVISDIDAGTTVLGYPAMPIWRTRRIWASLRRLPGLVKALPDTPGRRGFGGANGSE
jgi:UDP-3-O-[3-hydroxymyristoyl] glucosamine N-acyltransferase